MSRVTLSDHYSRLQNDKSLILDQTMIRQIINQTENLVSDIDSSENKLDFQQKGIHDSYKII